MYITEEIPIICCYCGKKWSKDCDFKVHLINNEVWCEECKKINTISLYRSCVICKMRYIPYRQQKIKLCHECEPSMRKKEELE